MGKVLKQRIWESFCELLNDDTTLINYVNYYVAVADWMKSNLAEFDYSIIKRNGIEQLLSVDASEYVVENPDISLEMEPMRIFENKPNTVDSFVMIIKNLLRDLTTIWTDKDCPGCGDGGLRYFIYETVSSHERHLVLECYVCIYAELADGTEWDAGLANVFPANKNDLESFK